MLELIKPLDKRRQLHAQFVGALPDPEAFVLAQSLCRYVMPFLPNRRFESVDPVPEVFGFCGSVGH